ncbi:MAG: hypothetical protein Q4G34_11360, partial [Micrococcus sp.]|nr:hypothetical protein [Micrococcus sp.]
MTTGRRRFLTTAAAAAGTAGATAALAPGASASIFLPWFGTSTPTLRCTSRYYDWTYRTYAGYGYYGSAYVRLWFGSYCGRRSVFVMTGGAKGYCNTKDHSFKDTCRTVCINNCWYRIIEVTPKPKPKPEDPKPTPEPEPTP